ncbi:MAG: ribonuclease HI [Gammaproteobacteria bacterium]|nr:ribonuclease HI [Gammaproteobacteria bacterium]
MRCLLAHSGGINVKKSVELYTDGACRGNPGPGAWAALLRFGAVEKMISGAVAETTNNQMELTAVIEGLQRLKEPCEVALYTDSQYVLKGMTEWIDGWIAKGWRTAGKKPVANQALWQALIDAAEPHHIDWHWVKGHSGHPENERVDQAANVAIDQMLENV